MARKVTSTTPKPTAEEAPTAAPPGAAGLSMRELGVADSVGPTELPRLQPRPPALMLIHPERWHVMHGEVVPLVGHLHLVGGLSNVRTTKAGLSISEALAKKQSRGWRPIPMDIDGPGTSYLHSPAPGVYLTKWETAHAGSEVVTHDGPGYVRWMRGHIDAGRLPSPPRYVLEQLRRQLAHEVLQLRDKVRTVPSAQVDLDRKSAALKVVERELGDNDLTPAPSRPAGLDELIADESEASE